MRQYYKNNFTQFKDDITDKTKSTLFFNYELNQKSKKFTLPIIFDNTILYSINIPPEIQRLTILHIDDSGYGVTYEVFENDSFEYKECVLKIPLFLFMFYNNTFEFKITRKNTTLQSHIFSHFEKSKIDDKTLVNHGLNLAEFDRGSKILLRHYVIDQQSVNTIKQYKFYLSHLLKGKFISIKYDVMKIRKFIPYL